MPTTVDGLYEVILEQTIQGRNVKNVFHYLATLGQDDDQDLIATAFADDILPGLQVITSVGLTFDEVRVANLTGLLADFSLVPSTTGGNRVGSSTADFLSMPYRLIRTTKETRNGAKRFGGLLEEDIQGGGFTAAYFIEMQTFAAILAGQISTTGIIAEPIVLRKPDVLGVWTYNEVSNVVAVNHQTTQNSRKKF